MGDDSIGLAHDGEQVRRRFAQRREKHVAEQRAWRTSLAHEPSEEIGILLTGLSVGPHRRERESGGAYGVRVERTRRDDDLVPLSAQFTADRQKWP
jgi:hypothetical protein